MDLFDSVGSTAAGIPDVGTHSPLAVRMRPRSLEEVAGQSHLLEAGSPLRRLVEPPVAGVSRAAPSSVVLWGPPGTGKRSEEHTSELQSRENLVCRLLLEKKKKT